MKLNSKCIKCPYTVYNCKCYAVDNDCNTEKCPNNKLKKEICEMIKED